MLNPMNELTAANTAIDASLRERWAKDRDGSPCYRLGHDPAELRRAETLERLDAEGSAYSLMRRRALAAEAEAEDLRAEVTRLRALLAARQAA